MLRKTMIALLTVASVGLVAPTMALARGGGGGHGGGFGGGGFHGGGFGGGGFHGGMAAGGFHGGGFHGGGFHHHHFGRGLAFGGFYGPYAYDDYPYYDSYYPYGYDDSYTNTGDCYVVHRRVHTKHGWQRKPVEVCG